MKNPSDLIENRTRDLRACNAVPQPTAPPRAYNDLLSTPTGIWTANGEINSAVVSKAVMDG
jgi:hypothetical protein